MKNINFSLRPIVTRYHAGNNGHSAFYEYFLNIMQNDSQRNYRRHSDNSRERASRGVDSVVHEWKVVSAKNSRHSGRAGILRDTRPMCIYEGRPEKSIMRNPWWNCRGNTGGRKKQETEDAGRGLMDAEDRKYMRL